MKFTSPNRIQSVLTGQHNVCGINGTNFGLAELANRLFDVWGLEEYGSTDILNHIEFDEFLNKQSRKMSLDSTY